MRGRGTGNGGMKKGEREKKVEEIDRRKSGGLWQKNDYDKRR